MIESNESRTRDIPIWLTGFVLLACLGGGGYLIKWYMQDRPSQAIDITEEVNAARAAQRTGSSGGAICADRQSASVNRRDIVPDFARHCDFSVSDNMPSSVFSTGRSRIAPMLSELDLDRWRARLVAELTKRQALTDLGRTAISHARSLGGGGPRRFRHRP